MKAILLAGLLVLTTLAVIAPQAAAEPQCMEVYSRTDVGNYAIVRKDSCSLEVYECPYAGAPISECWTLLR